MATREARQQIALFHRNPNNLRGKLAAYDLTEVNSVMPIVNTNMPARGAGRTTPYIRAPLTHHLFHNCSNDFPPGTPLSRVNIKLLEDYVEGYPDRRFVNYI